LASLGQGRSATRRTTAATVSPSVAGEAAATVRTGLSPARPANPGMRQG
ncbi:MAG: hypothetical protein QOE37_2391, partial [Microbacteriaceae bacterium]|nr:hypothetical protein [Microbacteriaceae bacterium]